MLSHVAPGSGRLSVLGDSQDLAGHSHGQPASVDTALIGAGCVCCWLDWTTQFIEDPSVLNNFLICSR